ncbi:hypothetical protein CRU98_13250 [Arcobacter sp. CECT 8986]|uniref:hypothetical protein n=1 Tax=Arcobacter sp. CECT 8986 TaxID=2044507 RepID=UPI001009CE31|nr:hypothetical protein [Arcobacter sp. CECT 8986]RXJ97594.1 hypothetical protein CRU98_13250 [Arcobacter sp. CECT 8986]
MFEIIKDKLVFKLNNSLYIDNEGIKQVKNKECFNPQTKQFKSDNFNGLNKKEIEIAKKYIINCKETNKYINNSYSLKHSVEKEFNTYISNGAFIVALELLKKKFRLYENIGLFKIRPVTINNLKNKVNLHLSYNVECKLKSY